ncbi:hypothetical protein HMPREF1423_00201, partial [Helicobacter pylori GAM270ASi]
SFFAWGYCSANSIAFIPKTVMKNAPLKRHRFILSAVFRMQ